MTEMKDCSTSSSGGSSKSNSGYSYCSSHCGLFIVLQALRKAEFSVGGSLESPPTGFTLNGALTLSLGFKSTEKDGLLLQNTQAVSFLLASSCIITYLAYRVKFITKCSVK